MSLHDTKERLAKGLTLANEVIKLPEMCEKEPDEKVRKLYLDMLVQLAREVTVDNGEFSDEQD